MIHRPAADNLPLFTPPRPQGATFSDKLDAKRLGDQARRVWECMRDGQWRTLREISSATGDPEASVSARLRDIRRWLVEQGAPFDPVQHRRRGDPTGGVWEYSVRLEVP